MKTGDTNYIYKNDLDKACYQQDMAYDRYKDLTKRKDQIIFWEIKLLKLHVIQNIMDMKED